MTNVGKLAALMALTKAGFPTMPDEPFAVPFGMDWAAPEPYIKGPKKKNSKQKMLSRREINKRRNQKHR